MPNSLHLSALLFVAWSTFASAATILSTDFTGVTTDDATDTVSNITWNTVSGINTPASSLVYVGNTEHGGADLQFFSASDLVSVNYNLANEGSYEFTIASVSLDAGTSSIDLTSLSLLLNATSNSGSVQSSNHTLELTVEVIGSISGSLGVLSFSASEPGNGTGTTYSVDLTSLSSLSSSETYDFVVNVDDISSPGVNAAMDDLLITGTITPVPEPGPSVLILAAGALFIRRRRR